MATFRLEHVDVIRPSPDGPVHVLQDLSCTLREGRVNVVNGPSGSGKSTLLRLLNRFEDPDSGTVRLDGQDLRELDVLALRRRVSLVAQVPASLGETVADNLAFPDRIGPVAGDATPPEELLRWMGLEPSMLARRFDSLSVGEQQRVAIARALRSRPQVLLLDEPTAALDAPRAAEVIQVIRGLRLEHGVTVVLITHRQEEARAAGEHEVRLEGGKVVSEGELSPGNGNGPGGEAWRG